MLANEYSLEEILRKLSHVSDEEKAKYIKGVRYERRSKKQKSGTVHHYTRFRADITYKNESFFLGRFHTLAEAIEARQQAEIALRDWRQGGLKPYFMKEKDTRKIPHSAKHSAKRKHASRRGLVPIDEWLLKSEDLEEWQWDYTVDGALSDKYLTDRQRRTRIHRKAQSLR